MVVIREMGGDGADGADGEEGRGIDSYTGHGACSRISGARACEELLHTGSGNGGEAQASTSKLPCDNGGNKARSILAAAWMLKQHEVEDNQAEASQYALAMLRFHVHVWDEIPETHKEALRVALKSLPPGTRRRRVGVSICDVSYLDFPEEIALQYYNEYVNLGVSLIDWSSRGEEFAVLAGTIARVLASLSTTSQDEAVTSQETPTPTEEKSDGGQEMLASTSGARDDKTMVILLAALRLKEKQKEEDSSQYALAMIRVHLFLCSDIPEKHLNVLRLALRSLSPEAKKGRVGVDAISLTETIASGFSVDVDLAVQCYNEYMNHAVALISWDEKGAAVFSLVHSVARVLSIRRGELTSEDTLTGSWIIGFTPVKPEEQGARLLMSALHLRRKQLFAGGESLLYVNAMVRRHVRVADDIPESVRQSIRSWCIPSIRALLVGDPGLHLNDDALQAYVDYMLVPLASEDWKGGELERGYLWQSVIRVLAGQQHGHALYNSVFERILALELAIEHLTTGGQLVEDTWTRRQAGSDTEYFSAGDESELELELATGQLASRSQLVEDRWRSREAGSDTEYSSAGDDSELEEESGLDEVLRFEKFLHWVSRIDNSVERVQGRLKRWPGVGFQ